MRCRCCQCGFLAKAPMRKHDRFFCPHCDVWLEPPCDCDPAECEFTGAPEKPSMVADQRTWLDD